MRKIIGVFALFFAINCFGQTPDYSTNNKATIKTADIKLLGFYPTPCNSLDATRMVNRIISKTYSSDTLFLQIGYSANCCFEFNPRVLFENNFLTVELSTQKQQTICECNCCYEMMLVLTGIPNKNFKVLLNQEELFLSVDHYQTLPEKHEIIDGDTINRVNKYGHKVGIWKYYNDSLKYVEKIVYFDGTTENDMYAITSAEGYYPNGNIKWRSFIDTSNCFYQSTRSDDLLEKVQYGFTLENYYESGKLKSLCTTVCLANSFDYLYRYWNEKGKEIKNRDEK